VLEQNVLCRADGESFTYEITALNACTGTAQMYTFTGSGGAVGQPFCFTVLVTDDQGGFCCSTMLCVPVPDCSTPGDLDADGVVGIVDLFELMARWGPCDDCPGCIADFDGSCTVDVVDMFELLARWG
jgi:hypothetical protein